ncbi:hypothetical protein RJT34_32269 [Clitoria ternatea]|uniref:RING-type E3 ubiquitin transferase n=1 Tax=Clitoria ternatea TaxID=43366 RepID=A0AAN9EVS6_CLITE
MGDDDANVKTMEFQDDSKSYALSGKIMLIAIVVLFIVIIIMLCLHAYVRWHLLRTRRRQHLRRNRRPQFVFYVDPLAPTALTLPSLGLRRSVIATLPVFTLSSATHSDPVECAVCLSEFENGETGRILPKCNHRFHTECIDVWFQSHSTCPLCRAPVEPQLERELGPEVSENEPGSSFEMCVECRNGEEPSRSEPGGSSSLCGEVSGRSESDRGNESSFRGILSFKRILSREKKGSVSGGTSMAELDLERGDSLS